MQIFLFSHLDWTEFFKAILFKKAHYLSHSVQCSSTLLTLPIKTLSLSSHLFKVPTYKSPVCCYWSGCGEHE